MLTKKENAKIILTVFALCLLYYIGGVYWVDRLFTLSFSHGKWAPYIALVGAALAGCAGSILLSTCAFYFSTKRLNFVPTFLRLVVVMFISLLGVLIISLISGLGAVMLQMLFGNQLSAPLLLLVIEFLTAGLSFLLLPVGIHVFFQTGVCTRAGGWHLRDMFADLKRHYFKILCLLAAIYAAGFVLNKVFSYLPDDSIRIPVGGIVYGIIGAVIFCILLNQYVYDAMGESQEATA